MKRLKSFFALTLILCLFSSLFSCTQNTISKKLTESGDLMNYYTSDVSSYISLSESDYKNAVFSYISSPVPSLESCLEQIALSHPDIEKVTDEAIKATDTVALYFYGEVDGFPFDGSYNILNSKPTSLPIPTAVWDGFAEALTGVIPNETVFQKNLLGIPSDGCVLYFSYSGIYEEPNGGEPIEVDCPLMRLDTKNVSASYATILEELYKMTAGGPSKSIGGISWDIDKDGVLETVDFTSLKLIEVTYEMPLTVDLTIPNAHYDKDLRGKTATFHIAVKHIEKKVPAAIDYEFMAEYFPLVSLDGRTPLEALTQLVEDWRLTLQNYDDYEAMSDAFYDALMEKAEVIAYPPNEVEGYMAMMRKEAIGAFEVNNQMAALGYQGYRAYTSAEAYARDYFGIKDGTSLESFLETRAKNIIKRSLILGYILQAEGLDVSEAGINAYKSTYYTRLSDYSAAFSSISQGTVVPSNPTVFQEEYEKNNGTSDLVPYLVFDHLKDKNTFTVSE